jgi:hypothetical protein
MQPILPLEILENAIPLVILFFTVLGTLLCVMFTAKT